MHLMLVALAAPVLKIIHTWSLFHVIGQLICSGEVHTVSLIDRKSLAATGNLSLPFSHNEITCVRIGINANHVNSVLNKSKRRVRSIHFKDLIRPEVADSEVHLAFRKFDLNGLVVQI